MLCSYYLAIHSPWTDLQIDIISVSNTQIKSNENLRNFSCQCWIEMKCFERSLIRKFSTRHLMLHDIILLKNVRSRGALENFCENTWNISDKNKTSFECCSAFWSIYRWIKELQLKWALDIVELAQVNLRKKRKYRMRRRKLVNGWRRSTYINLRWCIISALLLPIETIAWCLQFRLTRKTRKTLQLLWYLNLSITKYFHFFFLIPQRYF